MDNPGEILRLCRLCLVKDQVNIPIFEEQGDIRQIFLKISSCLPVTVSRDDQLPKKICDGCSNKLDLLYEFWNTSANAEKTLLSWLGQAGVKDADETISAVAQQIAKPAETQVKQEDLEDGHAISQDNFGLQSFDEDTKDEAEPPPRKRARRTAAVKAQISIAPESDDDDDDIDNTEAMTKVEGESEESDGEDRDPSYGEVPGTSADDQAGPSGVGKDGVEAPISQRKIITIKIERNDEKNDIATTNTFSCNICQKIYPTAFFLRNHMAQQHTHEYRYFCQFCNKGFYAQFGKNKHEKLVHLKLVPYVYRKKVKQDRFTCSHCGSKFDSNVYLQDHIVTVHTKEYRYFCDACDKGFYLQSKLNFHVRLVHLKTIPKRKYSASTLIKYKEKKKADDTVVCCPVEGCQKVLGSKYSLKPHMKTHENQKYVCEYCSKIFVSSCTLNRHLRLHKKDSKLYLCKLCDKCLSTPHELACHLRLHSGERPAQCEFCGKGFTCNRDLNVHRAKYHQENKNKYACRVCDRSYQSYGKLKQHYNNDHREIELPDETVFS